ncbi:uncharacterized protein LY79DRAFT_560089 [Colletotrichum navitas]|uniref:F-box domain-containing protein n=1 Tax=Colletotrichum navitas TaxID=681940 RepID=A0AAD8PVT5_9PEZI|nr:uncharacterized protein LY79DRAFT_560089 [Colletotrichum navitas]KAK1584823.1 hypothetical protein LY79DRAFT_560089 [Colletotrichum navitas]
MCGSTAKRHLVSLWRRAARLVPWQRSTLRLPPEIMLMVISYLPPEAVLSLALTCRSLYCSYFPESPILNARSKAALLTLLERDVPKLLYCSECAILHPWRRVVHVLLSGVRSGNLCKTRGFNPPSQLGTPPYLHARLIMNRHLYGNAHGFPVGIFDKDATNLFAGCLPVDCRSTWQARIIDDELFLYIHETAYPPEGDMFKLEQWLINDNRGRICKHGIVWNLPRSTSRSNVEPGAELELYDGRRNPHPLPAFLANMRRNTTLSCPLCPTDAEITTKWHGGRKKWSVEMKTWRQFGKCRSPSDPMWLSLTFTDHTAPPWDRQEEGYPPGAIRYKWNKSDKGLAVSRQNKEPQVMTDWVLL